MKVNDQYKYDWSHFEETTISETNKPKTNYGDMYNDIYIHNAIRQETNSTQDIFQYWLSLCWTH